MATAEQIRERHKELIERFRRSEEDTVKVAEEIHVQVLGEILEAYPNTEVYYRPNESGHWGTKGFGSIVIRPVSSGPSEEEIENRILDILENFDDVVSVYVKKELSARDRKSHPIRNAGDLQKVFYRVT